MSKYNPLVLNDYYNNNGFSYCNTNSGDFNSTGKSSSYPSEELPKSNEVIIVNNIPFIFPPKEPGKYNNIELNNQVIDVKYNKYKRIHLLGASDNGSFKEKIKLIGENSYERSIGFTDWLSKEPLYNEKIAIRCSRAYTNKGVHTNILPTIWYQYIDISNIENEIYAIKFRDNPSMHIFSITLEKMGDMRNEYHDAASIVART